MIVPGYGLVAGGKRHHAIKHIRHRHQFDAVGDNLAADQRAFHALGAHGDAVRDADGVELEGRAAGRADAAFDIDRQLAQVEVAGSDFGPGIGDADQWLGQVVIAVADRFEHGARAGSFGTVHEGAAALVEGGADSVCGHGSFSYFVVGE